MLDFVTNNKFELVLHVIDISYKCKNNFTQLNKGFFVLMIFINFMYFRFICNSNLYGV